MWSILNESVGDLLFTGVSGASLEQMQIGFRGGGSEAQNKPGQLPLIALPRDFPWLIKAWSQSLELSICV